MGRDDDHRVLLFVEKDRFDAAWHLAIATNKPRIIFVNEEGKMLPNFEIQRGKILPVCLKWHPVFQSLAIGWSDGCVTLWNEDQRQTREDKLLHKSPLTIITFSTDGSRMVTGD